MSLDKSAEALGSSNNAHKLYILAASRLDEINSLNSRTARCEHRVGEDNKTLIDIFGELAVIFVRLMRNLVAVKTDMTDLCGGNERENAVYHSKTCAQDRNDCELSA